MEHRTSTIPRKQPTPPFIGRLMDVDFAVVINESGVIVACSSNKPTLKTNNYESARKSRCKTHEHPAPTIT
jgi:hypothetical protein